MIHRPKIIYNPSEDAIEFRHDGDVYRIEGREKVRFEGSVAYHALEEVRGGLEEYEPKEGEIVAVSSVNYKEMPWKEIVKTASTMGIFKVGQGREETIAALIKADDKASKERGVI